MARSHAAHGRSALVVVFAGRSVDVAAGLAVARLASSLTGPCVLMPSSLAPDDALATTIGRGLAGHGLSSHLLVPDRPLGAVISAVPWGHGAWSTTTIALPDGPAHRILLPGQLVSGNPLVAVTDVRAVAGRGPFVLDLVARYAHPFSRVRLVADRDRAGRVAEANLAARPDWCLIGVLGSPAIVAVTRDLVAGELVALALAESVASSRGEFASPWEDRVVQRATELELGARIPDDIRFEVIASDGDTADAATDTVERLQRRIGIVGPAPVPVRIEHG